MPTLVLLRHGESAWNAAGRFAGWVDVSLTSDGVRDASRVGHMLVSHGYVPGAIHTSVLGRALQTVDVVQNTLGNTVNAIGCSWRLNERHYGALQGLSKSRVCRLYGEDQFQMWRRSYETAPPPIEVGSEWDVPRDRPYFGLEPDAIPRTESLADVTRRILPYWGEVIRPDLRTHDVVLVVAHSNALRAIVAFLEGLTGRELMELNIPTSQPLVYELDDDLGTIGFGRYLSPDAAAAAAAKVATEGRSPRSRTFGVR